ncbi:MULTISPECIES: Crp/Fnr family transcriptional regulator [unclassified Fusibacter]|uniref:Crp/Fnr family transcriptional regulator n=1 Tax=unclassified Fusibacter TaxID=2624464 RepID=UPI0010131C47|nr:MULTISPECIES: Crp/Fnr family transcriptional regulator [unclassified Fusibacter]MCK8059231.1 Crp/Fnr family transcriptional regulator [Fusibacter sp. A2]NPE21305.1 Crp/Fnr family transcriptional regulator [Fusibacter sp. A1]RXV62569.1 Crp/Fnr family transcriptional regulator [Fusibacter sp. A1]
METNWVNDCILFRGFDKKELEDTIRLRFLRFKSYKKGEVIVHEGDPVTGIGIVREGTAEIQSIYPSGKVLTLVRLSRGDVFGEAVVFSKNPTYPVTVVALTDITVGFIATDLLLELFHDYPLALNNYLNVLSNKLTTMNKKIKNLSLDTIRKRVANFLLMQYKNKGTKMFQTGLTRKSMADLMGIQRPSLSRELMKMKEDGLIDYDGETFKILDIERLEESLN